MKIFSNFDTNLRSHILEEYQQEYGVDNVLCFGRSRLYRMIKIVIPTTFLALITLLCLIISYHRLGSSALIYTIIGLIALDILILFPIIGKYIDYKLDFIIAIPSCMILYDQTGLFKRDVTTVSSQSIKTISIRKDHFLDSVFDTGDIIVLLEWDAPHQNGEIILRWVPKPEKRRNQVAKLIWLDSQANQAL